MPALRHRTSSRNTRRRVVRHRACSRALFQAESLETRRLLALLSDVILNPPVIDAAGGTQTYNYSSTKFDVVSTSSDVLVLSPFEFAFITPSSDASQTT